MGHNLIRWGQDMKCTLCKKIFDSDEDPDLYQCEYVSPDDK